MSIGRPKFRVIIAGSRDCWDYFTVQRVTDRALSKKIDSHDVIIVSGAATGIDTIGEIYALLLGLRCERFPANWDEYGIKAGPKRNSEMARVANALLAFPSIKSKGTHDMIKKMRGKPTKINNVIDDKPDKDELERVLKNINSPIKDRILDGIS